MPGPLLATSFFPGLFPHLQTEDEVTSTSPPALPLEPPSFLSAPLIRLLLPTYVFSLFMFLVSFSSPTFPFRSHLFLLSLSICASFLSPHHPLLALKGERVWYHRNPGVGKGHCREQAPLPRTIPAWAGVW